MTPGPASLVPNGGADEGDRDERHDDTEGTQDGQRLASERSDGDAPRERAHGPERLERAEAREVQGRDPNEEHDEPGVLRIGGGFRDGLRGQPDDPEVVGDVRRVVVIRRLEESQRSDDQEREGEQPEEEPVREGACEQEAGTVSIALVRAERRVDAAHARSPLLDGRPRRIGSAPRR